MCHPERNLHTEINRFYYVIRKLGITLKDSGVSAHGLRHQYFNDLYEELSGHPSPVRGGQVEDKEKENEVRLRAMLQAGHGRVN